MPSSECADHSCGIELDGLAVVGDAVFVAAVEHQMVRDQRVSLAVGWIDLADFVEPGIGRAVGEQFDGGVDGHGVERVGGERDGLVRFGGGCLRVGIFEREIGQQFVSLDQLGIELRWPWRPTRRPCRRSRRR